MKWALFHVTIRRKIKPVCVPFTHFEFWWNYWNLKLPIFSPARPKSSFERDKSLLSLIFIENTRFLASAKSGMLSPLPTQPHWNSSSSLFNGFEKKNLLCYVAVAVADKTFQLFTFPISWSLLRQHPLLTHFPHLNFFAIFFASLPNWVTLCVEQGVRASGFDKSSES